MTNRDANARRGFYVVHKYGRRRRGCLAVCSRCGTKRKATTSGWLWKQPDRQWTHINPPCARRAGVTP